jgi:transcriptional regulator with XRE-family HTH domain
MWTRQPKSRDALIKGFDREMLRSAFVSLFWAVIDYRKKHGGFVLKTLSDKIGVNKSAPSRWFSGERPNWTVNTIADIAGALDVEIEIRARDRQTGMVFAPHGLVSIEVKPISPPLAAIWSLEDAPPEPTLTVAAA